MRRRGGRTAALKEKGAEAARVGPVESDGATGDGASRALGGCRQDYQGRGALPRASRCAPAAGGRGPRAPPPCGRESGQARGTQTEAQTGPQGPPCRAGLEAAVKRRKVKGARPEASSLLKSGPLQ